MEGDDIISVALDADAAAARLDRVLAAALPQFSRERVKALIKAGRVAAGNGAVLRDPSVKHGRTDMLTVRVPVAVATHNVAQDMHLVISFEDEHLIIVDKPAGMVVHPAAGNADGTLVNALLHHCAGQLSGIGGVARPGIVHRIDKDTSGLIVAAKHDRAHEGLAKQFAAHSIARRYLALAAGRILPPMASIDAPMARSSANRLKMQVVDPDRGKRAVTHYRTLTALRDATLVECRLETGRTHQVRVHMNHIGHPLVGDPLYGRMHKGVGEVARRLGFVRQALHAAHLGFIHPVTGENVACDSDAPPDLRELIEELRV